MKITRYKKAQKTLNFYKNNFGLREPYQVLIDATFCQLALQNQINIQDQLPKYLQAELRLVTTQCIIMEAEALGGAVAGATQIVKQFVVHRCGHHAAPLAGAACMQAMVRQNNYIVATQDRELQEWLRLRPGQPLMYLHQRTPVLEQPTDVSRKRSAKKQDKAVSNFGDRDAKRLDFLKRSAGLPTEDASRTMPMRKKFKKKGPNPLSCKKKKKPTAGGRVTKAKARTES